MNFEEKIGNLFAEAILSIADSVEKHGITVDEFPQGKVIPLEDGFSETAHGHVAYVHKEGLLNWKFHDMAFGNLPTEEICELADKLAKL